jgi:glycolate oxidase iron-sulfur subunit
MPCTSCIDRKFGNLGKMQPAVIASANIGRITHLQSGTQNACNGWKC